MSYLHEEEKILFPSIESVICDVKGRVIEKGLLNISNFQILFTFSGFSIEENFNLSVPHGSVIRVGFMSTREYEVVTLRCRDMSVILFGIPQSEFRKKEIIKYINKATTPSSLPKLFAYSHRPTPDFWKIYKIEKEYKRMNILTTSNWRITDINKSFKLSETNSAVHVVPGSIEDDMLVRISTFREEGRFPFLSWGNGITNRYILRCSGCINIVDAISGGDSLIQSRDEIKYFQDVMKLTRQPTITFYYMEGKKDIQTPPPLPNNIMYQFLSLPTFEKLEESLTLVSEVMESLWAFSSSPIVPQTSQPPTIGRTASLLSLTDSSSPLRPTMSKLQRFRERNITSSSDSQAEKDLEPKQKLVRSPTSFLSKYSPQSFRRSQVLTSYSPNSNSTPPSQSPTANFPYFEKLKSSKWLQILEFVIDTCITVAQDLCFNEGQTIQKALILASTTGRGIIPSFSSFLQILIDPYYRSITGFIVLIEKEFLSFGHNFGNFTKKRSVDRFSAYFTLFMDCVWQILHQFPNEFEFNESMLQYIMEHGLQSGLFGTFFFPTQKLRSQAKPEESLPTVWSDILNDSKRFTNIHSQIQSGSNNNLNNLGEDDAHNLSLLRKLIESKNPLITIWHFYSSKRNRIIFTHTYHSWKSLLSTSRYLGIESYSITCMDDIRFPPHLQTTQFRSISLAHNLLSKFPAEFLAKFDQLEELNLSYNLLLFISDDQLQTAFPSKIDHQNQLTSLNLSHNQLVQLTSSIFKAFPNLRYLHLNDNMLRKIPINKILRVCPQLQFLSLANNDLSDYIANHKKSANPIISSASLTSLNLSFNSITTKLQFEIATLKELCLSGINIPSLASSFFLDLSKSSPQLESLYLASSHIPWNKKDSNDEIGILDSLQYFRNLRVLDLSNTSLKEITSSISELKQLAVLNLSQNQLQTLPEEFYNLRSLRVLNLNNNQLQCLDIEIARLSKLVELHLENNQLFALTPGVGNLQSLVYLNINGNQIQHIPATVGYLEKLQYSAKFYFQQQTVKLLTPPPHILSSGSSLSAPSLSIQQDSNLDGVFEYLKSLLQGETKLNRVKILIVGQENVGKTTLVRCLSSYNSKNQKLSKDQLETKPSSGFTENLSTDGVDISNISFISSSSSPSPSSKREKIELRIWDFAGQEIYYSTHQFFLSERAIYILVWNIAKPEEESRIEFWLKSIQSRAAKKASILLVATHTDHPKATSSKDYIKNQLYAVNTKYVRDYPNIERIMAVSCSSLEGIPELYSTLLDLVEAQDYLEEVIPTSYFELEKLIAEEAKKRVPPVMMWSDFCNLAKVCSIPSTDIHLQMASSLLHQIGSIIYFNEKFLSDIVILDPQWIILLMSTIITTKHQLIQNGILNHQNLPHIWKSPHFPDYFHSCFLLLLQKFEVVYYFQSYIMKPSTFLPNNNNNNSNININNNNNNINHSSKSLVKNSTSQLTLSSASRSNNNNLEGEESLIVQARQLVDSSIYQGSSLIPAMLPEERPSEIDRVWSIFPSNDERQIMRRYRFEFIPAGFISRLIIRTLHFAKSTTFWRYGIFVSSHDPKLLFPILELMNSSDVSKRRNNRPLGNNNNEIDAAFALLIEAFPARKIIEITVRDYSSLSSTQNNLKSSINNSTKRNTESHHSDDSNIAIHFFQLMVDMMESLIGGWNYLKVKVSIPCIHCLQSKLYDPYIFQIADVERAVIEANSVILCRNTKRVLLHHLAADLSMLHVAQQKIEFSELIFEDEIGKGGYATIYKGRYQGASVAIKKLKFHNYKNETNSGEFEGDDDDDINFDAFAEFRREVWIMCGLKHQNLLQLIGYTLHPQITIITEYLSCGNLYDLLHDRNRFPTLSPFFLWRLAIDIAKGMNMLHTLIPAIIHGDLKSPNILIHSLNESDTVIAKVADFGLSQILASSTIGSEVDNPIWLAPEILNHQEYTEKVDVYAYGVILWEISTREDFFGECRWISQIATAVVEGKRPAIPSTSPFKELISKCWHQEAVCRPSFVEILDTLQLDFTRSFPSYEGDHIFYEDSVSCYQPETEDDETMSEEIHSPNSTSSSNETEDDVITSFDRVNPSTIRIRSEEDIILEQTKYNEAKRDHLLREKSSICTEITKLESSVLCMKMIPSLEEIWVGTSSGNIYIFDVQKRDMKFHFAATESKPVIEILPHYSPSYVVTLSVNGEHKLWLSSKGKVTLKNEIKSPKTSFCICNSSKYIFSGCRGEILVLDAKLKCQKKIKFNDLRCIMNAMIYDEFAGILWVGIETTIHRFTAPKFKPLDVLVGHEGIIRSFIQIENNIWSCSKDNNIIVWNSKTGALIKKLTGHTGPVLCIVSTPTHVWSGSFDKSVIIWDIQTMMYDREFEAHSDSVNAIVYCASSMTVWTASNDGCITSWQCKKIQNNDCD